MKKNIKNKMVMMMMVLVITTLASRGSSLLEKIVVSYSGVTVPTTLLWPDIKWESDKGVVHSSSQVFIYSLLYHTLVPIILRHQPSSINVVYK